MDRSHLLVAFLLGVCVSLGTALVMQSGGALPQAHAQAAAGGGQMFAVTGTGTTQTNRDVLFVLDPNTTRLMVYEYKDGRLTVGAIRNMEFDARFQEWADRGRDQRPSVKDMKVASEKQKDN